MSNIAHSLRPQFCNYCNSANAIPRVEEKMQGEEIIKEAKWICPKCGNLVRRMQLPKD